MHATRVVVGTVVAALGLLAVSMATAGGASPCGAHGVLSNGGTQFSCQYSTVGEDTFSVPAGVTSVSVVAVGAPGGNGGLYDSQNADGAAGGLGAVVTAPSVSVAGDSTLYVEVGGPGGHGEGTLPGTEGFCPGGTAGAGGGGTGGNGRCDGGSGGGGGGESDVRTVAASAGGLTGGVGDPRLVVAGGGGGGGGEYYTAGGVGGSSGGSAASGAGAGGGNNCETPMNGVPGGTGETGGGGGAGGVISNTSDCSDIVENGSAGSATSGGAGGDGNEANSTGPGGGGGGYFGGGGGAAVGGTDGPGGGGGSSYAPAGSTFAAASAATPPSVTVSWSTLPPTVAISAPANGASYTEGQVVTSSFACTEASGGPGIASCLDQTSKASGSAINTSTAGAHTFTVTGKSDDGLTGTASVTYTVTAKPTGEAAPAISGTAAAGHALSCSTGTWANQPIAFAYQWSRDGTPLVGATSSTYTVATLDEGTTLTCTVTAANTAGIASMTSAGVNVPVPYVPRCPAASGSLSGSRLGSVRLGMTRAQAHHAYRHSSDRGEPYEDFFCLTPIGIRVGYASPKLVHAVPASPRGRVVWASTSNPRYAIHGVRPGALLKAASRQLRLGQVLRIGLNDWYLAPDGSVTAVLKVRRGVVEEIGIAERALTSTRKQQSAFMRSFE